MTDIDNRTITVGRYKGQCMNDVAEADPGFVVTLFEAVGDSLNTSCVCSFALYKQCQDHVTADQMARDIDQGEDRDG